MFAAENSPRVKDKKDEVVKSGEVRCLQYIFKKKSGLFDQNKNQGEEKWITRK